MTAPGGLHTVKLYNRSVDVRFNYESPKKKFITSSSRKSLIAPEQSSRLSQSSNRFYKQKPSELSNNILAQFEEFHSKLLSKKMQSKSPFRSKLNQLSRLKEVPIKFINLFDDSRGKYNRPSRLGAKKQNKEKQYQTPKKESSRKRGLQTVYSNKSPMKQAHSNSSQKKQDKSQSNPRIQNTCASNTNFTRGAMGRQILSIRAVIRLALSPRRA